MQLTRDHLKRVNIFSLCEDGDGYIGKKTRPKPLGFVYAEVFPEKETLRSGREGKKTVSDTTLILRRGAGVSCGDLAGIYGENPDSRVIEVARYPGHVTVRTVSL